MFADKLKQQLTEYVELRSELFKAQFTDKFSRTFSKLVTGLLLLVLGFFLVLFGSLVIGFYFGEMMGSLMKGFAIVAACYLVLILVIWLFRKSLIETPIANTIIGVMYEEDEA